MNKSLAPMLVAVSVSILIGPACQESTEPATAEPSRLDASPTPEVQDAEGPSAEEVLENTDRFTFEDMPADVESDLRKEFVRVFSRMRPLDIAVKRVATEPGDTLPVRAAVVTYQLPKGAPLGALAYELGREFLGATPRNSTGVLEGRGVRMTVREDGMVSERVVFFIGDEIFVYLYGLTPETPTEEVARALLQANIAYDD